MYLWKKFILKIYEWTLQSLLYNVKQTRPPPPHPPSPPIQGKNPGAQWLSKELAR